MTETATKAIVRAAEIREASLSLRGARGDEKASLESRRLANALSNHRRLGVNIVEALHAAGADVDAVAAIAKTAN